MCSTCHIKGSNCKIEKVGSLYVPGIRFRVDSRDSISNYTFKITIFVSTCMCNSNTLIEKQFHVYKIAKFES